MASAPLVWFITGTSSGFGRHLVDVALNRGDRVIATARSQSSISDLDSINCHTMELDVTSDLEILERKAKEALAIWGRVDVVVNNAGFAMLGTCEELGVSGFQKQFAANFFGVINIDNAFLPYLRAARSGTIVIIGSRHAWKTKHPMTAAYASSKAAVHAYGETLSTEVAQFNIRVLVVQPGAHRTEGLQNTSKNSSIYRNISDYQTIREQGRERMVSQKGKQPGDAQKAAEAIFDVVRGKNAATGKPWPLWLVLGRDAEDDLRQNLHERLVNLEQWRNITQSTCISDGDVVSI